MKLSRARINVTSPTAPTFPTAVALASLVVGCCFGSVVLGQDTIPATKLVVPWQEDVVQPIEKKAEPKKRADIYDVEADAKVDIAAALAKAKKNNSRVLIQWGANWCSWCHLLHELCQTDREIARKLLYEYEVVLVDIGDWGKNADLAEKYEADLKGNGVPYLTVLDADGKVLANQETGSLEGGESAKKSEKIGHDSEKVMAFLTEHEAEYLKAESVLEAGLSQAAREGKRVFLHFGAPWCGWCHRLEDWMARPEIAKILMKGFVDVKIDTDRMVGGAEMLTEVRGPGGGGIPWFVILDEKGKSLITSDGAKGNVGFPVKENEIAHFMKMLRTTVGENLSEKELGILEASLRPKKAKDDGDGH